MRLRGLEPPRGCPHMDLNHARLPNSATAACGARRISRKPTGSSLAADPLQENRDVLAAVEPHVDARAARTQADRMAGVDEEVEDVLRQIREVVAHVLVAARSVDEHASVRAD